MPLSPQEILLRLTLVPVFVATLIGGVQFRRLQPSLRYLAAGLIGFILPMEVLGLAMLLQHRNNLFLMPIYTVGEFGLLAIVYCHALQSVPFTRLLPWLIGSFAAYAIIDSLSNNVMLFRPGQQIVQSVLILGLVGLYFRKLLQELTITRLEREPMFWVSTGLMIYFMGYLQIALFSNYLLRYSDQLNMNIWGLHSLLFMLLYCCYSIALWMRPEK
ncbi:hypothetical protein GO988_17335 [Hymenobacter sp. HMF4947]|uniref:Uncharacterized protein n=1 Tax=Hymenobacter ginkgonis TaxID=2682976 RepID=A0A7K1TIE6_9BACT|nr:hypothetical protein [Hymenobacter ginkgonis]MVN78096.1 hypothetical protein [Hymenobacter ginkgonis]